MKSVRENMQALRTDRQITRKDLARDISEMFGEGYHLTDQMLYAIEGGITKSVPTWVVIGYMMQLNLFSADEIFQFLGDA